MRERQLFSIHPGLVRTEHRFGRNFTPEKRYGIICPRKIGHESTYHPVHKFALFVFCWTICCSSPAHWSLPTTRRFGLTGDFLRNIYASDVRRNSL
jgi:hypothetical protein